MLERDLGALQVKLRQAVGLIERERRDFERMVEVSSADFGDLFRSNVHTCVLSVDRSQERFDLTCHDGRVPVLHIAEVLQRYMLQCTRDILEQAKSKPKGFLCDATLFVSNYLLTFRSSPHEGRALFGASWRERLVHAVTFKFGW